jgi:hypothetical protein
LKFLVNCRKGIQKSSGDFNTKKAFRLEDPRDYFHHDLILKSGDGRL